MSRDIMVKRGSKASRTLILDFPKSFQTGGLKLKWTRLKNHINWSTVAWISVHSGNSEEFSNLNQICWDYYVKPVTTSLSLLFCATPGFVTTTTHMLCLYLTQGYSNGSVQNVNKSFTKTTTLDINAGIPITLIAEHKFQGSGNLTEK